MEELAEDKGLANAFSLGITELNEEDAGDLKVAFLNIK